MLHPPSVRDFYAFEQHVRTARERRGLEVPPEWYEIPVFYFSNPAAIFGPEQEIPYPEGTEELDYELEVAAVMGADGAIGGFTVMNDWSARDLQRHEMRVGLGPVEGQGLRDLDRPGRRHAGRARRVRRRRWSRASTARSARAGSSATCTSRGTRSWRTRRGTRGCSPGEILGSGTVGTGCILELGDGRWLRPGDVVELEVEGIGVLRNTVGPRTA